MYCEIYIYWQWMNHSIEKSEAYMSFKFEYHPRDKNGFILPREVLVIHEFKNIDHLIAIVLLDLAWFKSKDRSGNWPDSVAKRLGLVPYERIESFRRSDEWHDAVNKFTQDHNKIKRLTMSKKGRISRCKY